MNGIDLDPNVLIQTQANMLAQNAVHIAQLEAAVQQLGAQLEEAQAQIPVEKEGEDGETAVRV